MHKVVLPINETIAILSPRETRPDDAFVCMSEMEYRHAVKMAAGFSQDPEQTRGFWEAIWEKKKTIPGYSFLDDFPPEEIPRSEAARLAAEWGPKCRESLRTGRVE